MDEAIRREFEDLLLPILDDYNIPRADPNRWLNLCWWLAQECGRLGVRPAKAPIKFDDYAYATLIYRIAMARSEIAAELGCTDEDVSTIDACRRIVREHPEWYGTKKGGRVTAETLARRLREAPPSSFTLLRNLLDKAQGSRGAYRIPCAFRSRTAFLGALLLATPATKPPHASSARRFSSENSCFW